MENIEDLDVTLKTVKELYVSMQKILKAQHTLHDDWMRVDELLGNELNVRRDLKNCQIGQRTTHLNIINFTRITRFRTALGCGVRAK